MKIDTKGIIERSEKIFKHFGLELDGEEKARFFVMGLIGEVGEVANLFKKNWRAGNKEFLDDINVELMDVLIYLVLLMDATGFNLDQEYKINVKKLEDRWPSIKEMQ
jgi:NTP pyrophosphatase (non-canonical NTP hydrolase)